MEPKDSVQNASCLKQSTGETNKNRRGFYIRLLAVFPLGYVKQRSTFIRSFVDQPCFHVNVTLSSHNVFLSLSKQSGFYQKEAQFQLTDSFFLIPIMINIKPSHPQGSISLIDHFEMKLFKDGYLEDSNEQLEEP